MSGALMPDCVVKMCRMGGKNEWGNLATLHQALQVGVLLAFQGTFLTYYTVWGMVHKVCAGWGVMEEANHSGGLALAPACVP